MLEFELVLIQNSEALLRVLYGHRHLRCCNILYSMKQIASHCSRLSVVVILKAFSKCADSLLNE